MVDLRSLPLGEVLLRISVAFAFLFPAINAIFDPYSWIGYFPSFVLNSAGSADILLLHAFGLIEAVIALWILFGRNIRTPSAIATAMLLVIVALNLNQFAVLFRDISIALMSAALAWMHRNNNG